MHYVLSCSNWILADNIFDYESNKEKYSLIAKPLRGFKEGLLQIEKELSKKVYYNIMLIVN